MFRFRIGYDPATGRVDRIVPMSEREPDVQGLSYIVVDEYPELDDTVIIPGGMGPALYVENGKVVTRFEPLRFVADSPEETLHHA